MNPYLKLSIFAVSTGVVGIVFLIGGLVAGSAKGLLLAVLGGIIIIALAVGVGAVYSTQRKNQRDT